ncbi:MAG: polyhydroxyalkanoic acid system family protein [Gemmataceae bacterium]|nr:polyhydroxyalkanoic acid system family protein [Gemmataceae bacterium]
MSKMTLSIPHQFTREEARRRIQGQMGQLRTQSGGLIAQVDERWTGDTMAFTALVLNTPINGQMWVEDRLVRVEVDLPWFLQAIGTTLGKALETRTRAMLENRKLA